MGAKASGRFFQGLFQPRKERKEAVPYILLKAQQVKPFFPGGAEAGCQVTSAVSVVLYKIQPKPQDNPLVGLAAVD